MVEKSKAMIGETHKLTLMRSRDLEGGGSLGWGKGLKLGWSSFLGAVMREKGQIGFVKLCEAT